MIRRIIKSPRRAFRPLQGLSRRHKRRINRRLGDKRPNVSERGAKTGARLVRGQLRGGESIILGRLGKVPPFLFIITQQGGDSGGVAFGTASPARSSGRRIRIQMRIQNLKGVFSAMTLNEVPRQGQTIRRRIFSPSRFGSL
ncbi:hypothetical protein EBZ70_04225 [bacterium]|nr:hypothetical protein [bacterium]